MTQHIEDVSGYSNQIINLCYCQWTGWNKNSVSQERIYQVGMYQRAIGVGATPFERLTTAFLGALRIGRQGLKAAEAGRIEDAMAKGERLYAIVKRMDQSLDFSIAPDLCKNLTKLYKHVLALLSDPELGSKPQSFAESVQILSTLWEGFQAAEEQGKS